MADRSHYDFMLRVPESLKEHPELIRRGIAVCDILKPVRLPAQVSPHVLLTDHSGTLGECVLHSPNLVKPTAFLRGQTR